MCPNVNKAILLWFIYSWQYNHGTRKNKPMYISIGNIEHCWHTNVSYTTKSVDNTTLQKWAYLAYLTPMLIMLIMEFVGNVQWAAADAFIIPVNHSVVTGRPGKIMPYSVNCGTFFSFFETSVSCFYPGTIRKTCFHHQWLLFRNVRNERKYYFDYLEPHVPINLFMTCIWTSKRGTKKTMNKA